MNIRTVAVNHCKYALSCVFRSVLIRERGVYLSFTADKRFCVYSD